MHRTGNLFEKVISFPNLLAAARAARKGKRGRPDVAAFFVRLEPALFDLQAALATGAYRPGPYHAFHIRDPKPRLISAAPFVDRVVHHAVCQVIEPLLDRGLVFDSYANRRGKGTHAALDRCTDFCRKSRYVLRCDVEKFFPSADHQVLASLLDRHLKCRRTLDLLCTIIASSNPQECAARHFPGDDLLSPLSRRRGLPIGNLTSQLFGNLLLDPLDHWLKEKKRRRYYLRYCDDFLVFGDDKTELAALLPEIREFLYRFRLTLHPRKCVVAPTRDGVPFLGWRVFPDHRRLLRATGLRFQRGLCKLREAYAKGELPLDRVRASLASWIGHLLHGDTWGLRRKLLAAAPFVLDRGEPARHSVSR